MPKERLREFLKVNDSEQENTSAPVHFLELLIIKGFHGDAMILGPASDGITCNHLQPLEHSADRV